MTQVELAEQMGVGRSSIAMWEIGEHFPHATLLPQLARVLNCKIDELFVVEQRITPLQI